MPADRDAPGTQRYWKDGKPSLGLRRSEPSGSQRYWKDGAPLAGIYPIASTQFLGFFP
jgi:hypothetical protein